MFSIENYMIGVVIRTKGDTVKVVFPEQKSSAWGTDITDKAMRNIPFNDRIVGWITLRGFARTKCWSDLSQIEKSNIAWQFNNRNVEYISFQNLKAESFTLSREDFTDPLNPNAQNYIGRRIIGDDTVSDETLEQHTNFYSNEEVESK